MKGREPGHRMVVGSAHHQFWQQEIRFVMSNLKQADDFPLQFGNKPKATANFTAENEREPTLQPSATANITAAEMDGELIANQTDDIERDKTAQSIEPGVSYIGWCQE